MVTYEHRDYCSSYRQSVFDTNVFYAVAEDTYWDVHRTYDCPVGYHWASTEEGYSRFTSKEDYGIEQHWHSEGGEDDCICMY